MNFVSFDHALRFQNTYEQLVRDAASYIKERLGKMEPHFCVVLGSGLGSVSKSIDIYGTISYSQIPNFPATKTEGHENELLFGKLEGIPIIGMNGRKHYYEVADDPLNTGILQVVFPVNVIAELGVPNYFSTNATGGINPRYKVRDAMVIKSHDGEIPNPLLGRLHNFKQINGEPVERFVNMSDAYDREFRDFLIAAAGGSDRIHEGFYYAVTGPTYETTKKSLDLRARGFDAVGMSTTPEITAARSRGMRCVGVCCITDMVDLTGQNPVSHKEVMTESDSEEVKERFSDLLKGFLGLYKKAYF